jgi:hypothetical protein
LRSGGAYNFRRHAARAAKIIAFTLARSPLHRRDRRSPPRRTSRPTACGATRSRGDRRAGRDPVAACVPCRVRPRARAAVRSARRRSGLGRGAEFTLPLPDGRMARFRAVETPILGPRCAARIPTRTSPAVVGGSPGMTGAPVLAATAAQRAGAGYVRLSSPGVPTG